MPMRSFTLVILTALLTAGLPAKAEITLEALEAGSGVPWPQALRDQVAGNFLVGKPEIGVDITAPLAHAMHLGLFQVQT